MSTNAIRKNGSVAVQQKVGGQPDYAKLANEQLHHEMLDARNGLFEKCLITQKYAAEVLVPLCEAIIARYKMQGVAAKDRPNGKPTVEAYFRSIHLNYNTVRSWIHRKRLQTEMFQPKKPKNGKRGNGNDKVRHLTELEARLLGTASAGHDLVKAIRHGGNVDEAAKDFLEHAPTPERIEEYIERPVDSAAERLKGLTSKNLAKGLATEIARLAGDSGNGECVRICGNGKGSIRYENKTDSFYFTVRVQNQQQANDEGRAIELAKGVAGSAQ